MVAQSLALNRPSRVMYNGRPLATPLYVEATMITRWHFFWQAGMNHLGQLAERIKSAFRREEAELDRIELELAERDRMIGGLRMP